MATAPSTAGSTVARHCQPCDHCRAGARAFASETQARPAPGLTIGGFVTTRTVGTFRLADLVFNSIMSLIT